MGGTGLCVACVGVCGIMGSEGSVLHVWECVV